MSIRLIASLRTPPLPPSRPAKIEDEASVPVYFGRRNASICLLSLAASSPFVISELCPPAAAISLGISGPKDWLREQKKSASRFVLAPIDASRRSLQSVYLLLSRDSDSPLEDPVQVRQLIKSAARDCVAEDRNSIVAFQANSGVEVCTYRLILKNASSLLDKYDPLNLEAGAKLDTLVRTFTVLGKTIDDADLQLNTDREKVKIGINATIFALGKFEESIKNCLGV